MVTIEGNTGKNCAGIYFISLLDKRKMFIAPIANILGYLHYLDVLLVRWRRSFTWRISYLVPLFLLCFITLHFGYAQALPIETSLDSNSLTKTPALIEADNISYDTEGMIVTATGHVEVHQAARILLADEIIYDKNKDMVSAKGNVSLLEENGMVVFADEVRLSDALKKGVVENLKARFVDESLIAAQNGRKLNEDVITMNRVVYSPCPLCKKNPNKAPLWQVSARQATINEKKQRVTYKNAFFEVYGVPVLYTPFFSHPTPKAQRKSGFLTPKYSHDRIFGTILKTPYYYNIAPNKDAVITPVLTSKEGGILSGEYRHLLKEGSYNIKASITNPERVDVQGNKIEGNDIRSHIEGAGHFSVTDVWDWGFYGKRSSDDTYLKKYHFGEEDVLTSKLYATRIENRDHILIHSLSFQGLKVTDDPGKSPLIMPYGEAHIERKIGTYNTRTALDANVLALTRDEGVSSRRVSVKGSLLQPLVTKSGNLVEGGVSLRGDVYSVDNVLKSSASTETYDGVVGRMIPEASIKWSMPLIKHSSSRQYLIEPVTKLIISPNGGNPNDIPNEDSQDVEFSAENLFDSNHFSGYDRIESGTRINYGIRGSASDDNKGSVSFLFGQSYRSNKDQRFSTQSGLVEKFSDYVGKVGYSKDDVFDIAYKFRFDKDSFTARNNTVSSIINYKPVHFSLDYVSINDSSVTVRNGGDSREILISGVTIDINDKWQFIGNGNRNLANGEWVSTSSGIVYKGACVDFTLDWVKEFTRDRDIQPSTTVSFQVSLKNMSK